MILRAKLTAGVAFSAVLCLGAAMIATPVRGEGAELDAREILDRVDDLFRGDASRGEMSMTITTAHWQRTLSVAFWSRGEEESLMRILAPKKEKGTATLRVGTNLWNYLPKVNRVIKLPSSMMSASWMGSHFTNNDLVKQSRMADDYTFEQSFAGERDGEEVIEITCVPGPEAAVVWGKVEVRVRRGDFLPLRISYYDERMELARTMRFSEFRTLDGRLLPAKMTVAPADQPEESTVVEYHAIDFDPELDDDVFSLHNLRR